MTRLLLALAFLAVVVAGGWLLGLFLLGALRVLRDALGGVG